ncbi:MAG: FAD-binding oxidoreductase [Ardenticatenaceae bacterium]|nr:FAD-binding oxidoreductase [Anaerolineales bacterium]MCB8923521.1 FAD-binding oxidoreductase [Ardenticatenaceae bacterium]MCB8991908.1 FAD-binding oxidoreductase [Ardenticatenaceae bacterium]MCB9003754.1 FAD-binding oxidoreductase [Ardenticatenaceae bacterium]
MRRWNGWGDDTIEYPLPENAAAFLDELVGPGKPPVDAPLAEVVAAVPPSRLPPHPLVKTDAAQRVLHARGQSLPDWVALRYGRLPTTPDGIAQPTSEEEVADLLQYAANAGVQVIPYGGGTSVVGHINPQADAPPTLTVNTQRLNKLLALDEASRLATFGAGVQGPDLEAQLRAHGYTLGHFPQSFEYSTLGGWVVTRSSGQQSLGYGRIEHLFAGGTLLAPAGRLEMLPHPASAAGPDLRQLVLGSEGRMGILTQATVRISALPEREDFHAVFFPDFESGQAAARQMMQAGIPLSMLRLSTAVETTTTLALAGHEQLIGLLERLLAIRSVEAGKCMLLLGFTGSNALVKMARGAALEMTGNHGGVHVGRTFGSQWHKGRFRTPYLRNSLWQQGYAVDTLETAVPWANVPATLQAIEDALHPALAEWDERVHVFTHLSHMYGDGASIYTTYLFRLTADPEETLARWRKMKAAASEAIVANHGTISHQHGVGTDHAPYLPAEKGTLGMAALCNAIHTFDPAGMMNAGKLVE